MYSNTLANKGLLIITILNSRTKVEGGLFSNLMWLANLYNSFSKINEHFNYHSYCDDINDTTASLFATLMPTPLDILLSLLHTTSSIFFTSAFNN